MKSPRIILQLIGLLTAFLLLAACGKKADAPATVRDNTAELKQYYSAHSDFYHFKTPADLPTTLKWEDGMELPEFASPEAKKGGTLNFWVDSFPPTLRVIGPDANNAFRNYLLDDVSMELARPHPNATDLTPNGYHYIPGIAQSWAVDRENKTVYIKIDPAARWSDGVPITADDIFFQFYFFRSKDIQEPWYNNYYTTKFTALTRYDDYTVSISFPEARPDMLALTLETEPIPAHFYKEFGPDYPSRYQWRFIPTSGAYIVKDADVDKGRAITLTRDVNWWAKDKKFWRNRYNPDRIRFTIIRDTPKAFESFKKGDLDFFRLGTPEYWYDKLPNSDPLVAKGYIQKSQFYNDVARPSYGLYMNQTVPLLSDQHIREGIQYAMNWKLVIEKFSRGDWQRMRTSADGFASFTDPKIQPRPFDIEKAQANFAAAGFSQRGPDGILLNNQGERLSLQLTTGYDQLKDVLTILREEALKAGLELRLEILDSTTHWKKTQEKKHEIVFTALNVSQEVFPRYWETFDSSNAYDRPFLPDGTPNPSRKIKAQTNNLTEYASLEMDKLIQDYDHSTDLLAMREMAFKMEDLIYENAAFCPGFITPFIRSGAWRWIKSPDQGNVRIARQFDEYFLYWIDEKEKADTQAAMKRGESLSPIIKVYDQYKQP